MRSSSCPPTATRATFFDRTLGFQASRGSPFSIWGLRGWTTAQTIVQIAGVLLAVAVAFLPRRRDLIGLAALSAAVLIGLQLGITHWFYLYIVWFYGAADGRAARRPRLEHLVDGVRPQRLRRRG